MLSLSSVPVKMWVFFPWTEESHLERCDSLMELCTVNSARDSNSALRWAEKPQGYYCSCHSSACYQPDETWSWGHTQILTMQRTEKENGADHKSSWLTFHEVFTEFTAKVWVIFLPCNISYECGTHTNYLYIFNYNSYCSFCFCKND